MITLSSPPKPSGRRGQPLLAKDCSFSRTVFGLSLRTARANFCERHEWVVKRGGLAPRNGSRPSRPLLGI
ncbi:hypothetical protein VTJ04DRAFT_674 [Mycothermus thermophilus]|uniref:uncharacterized protein n=1 Tax=Humicola insolens TaxID=85995 RepID=UPI00374395A5